MLACCLSSPMSPRITHIVYLSAHYITIRCSINNTNGKTPNLRASYYAEEGNSVPVSIGINHAPGINHCMTGCKEASHTNEFCLCHCTPNCPSSNTQRRTGQGHEETGLPKSANSEPRAQPSRACVDNCVSIHQSEAGRDDCIHQCPALSVI